MARILKLAGFSGRRQTPHIRRRDAEREQILVLRSQGKNGEQIAQQLAIPVDRVYTAISQASALDPRFSLGKSHLTQDELDQIATLHGQSLPIPEIARRCGRSQRTVHRAIARLRGEQRDSGDSRRRSNGSAHPVTSLRVAAVSRRWRETDRAADDRDRR